MNAMTLFNKCINKFTLIGFYQPSTRIIFERMAGPSLAAFNQPRNTNENCECDFLRLHQAICDSLLNIFPSDTLFPLSPIAGRGRYQYSQPLRCWDRTHRLASRNTAMVPYRGNIRGQWIPHTGASRQGRRYLADQWLHSWCADPGCTESRSRT